jgi:hypothetical protein
LHHQDREIRSAIRVEVAPLIERVEITGDAHSGRKRVGAAKPVWEAKEFGVSAWSVGGASAKNCEKQC